MVAGTGEHPILLKAEVFKWIFIKFINLEKIIRTFYTQIEGSIV